MITLDEIRNRLVAGAFEFSRHAFKRAVERNISERDIQQMITRDGDDYVSLPCLWQN